MTQIKDGPFEKMEEEAKRNQAMLQTKVGQTKADWLRSEIEKLEGMKKLEHQDWCKQTAPLEFASCGCWKDWNYALTSIITRYKEELKELTGE